MVQEFVDGYYHQFPEEAYEVGYPDTPMDRLGDRSEAAMAAWRAREDAWLATLTKITYMLEHTVEARAYIETEIDRYLAVPGQATAYMIGSLEIQRLRRDAERQLGTRFDIKSFHDVILRDGAVTLPMLQKAVARWVRERSGS